MQENLEKVISPQEVKKHMETLKRNGKKKHRKMFGSQFRHLVSVVH